MKSLKKLPILPLIGIGASVVFTSCGTLGTLNKSISNTGYNPLDGSGMKLRGNSSSQSLVNANDHGFKNGDIVEVVIQNTALFAQVPKAGDRYKEVLAVGATLRVVGGEKDFIKVLTEDGKTGYVSSVMVVSQGSLTDTGLIDPNVTEIGADGTPIVPDIAPEPIIPGIGAPDPIPGTEPTAVPDIDAPVPADPEPSVVVPDPTPVVPSLPEAPLPKETEEESPE